MLELYNDQDLKNILVQARIIAVVGAKDKPGQPVDNVGRYLIKAGYRVVPVHPKRTGVWGLETWKSLAAIPFSVDIINLFRAEEHCPGHALEVLRLSSIPLCFWMQSGIYSQQSGTILQDSPITVIQNRCIMTEHQRLVGGMV